MSIRINIWEKELDGDDGIFTTIYAKDHHLPPSVDSFDTMHVQLRLPDVNVSFSQVLDFTSQRTEI